MFGILQNTTLYFILRGLVRFSIGSFILSLCCVFRRLGSSMLPISLDCPFLIAPSVFPNVYSLTTVQFAIKISNLKKKILGHSAIGFARNAVRFFTLRNPSYNERVGQFYDQRPCFLLNDVKLKTRILINKIVRLLLQ
jgi:hypothetical protein